MSCFSIGTLKVWSLWLILILMSLLRTLEDVLSEVEQLVSRSKWRRAVFHESDKRKIADCQGRLQHRFMQFQVSLTAVPNSSSSHVTLQMGVAISTSLDIHSVRADVVQLKTLASTSLVHSSRILVRIIMFQHMKLEISLLLQRNQTMMMVLLGGLFELRTSLI